MVTTTIETIDTERAKLYLADNMVNRRLSQQRVIQYADSLRRGDWQLNGESIKFNDHGEMIDGQHRLSAIIYCNIPMTTVVMRGIDDGVSIIDRGRNRNLADSLLIEGISKSIANNTIIAIVKLHHYIQTSLSNCSDSFVREYIEAHADNLERVNSILTGDSHAPFKIKAAPMGLAMFYAGETEVGFDELDKFAKAVRSGFYETRRETAAIVIRNDLINNPMRNSNLGARKYTCYAIEKAIYDYHHGIERKKSYRNVDKPTYSNNAKFAVERGYKR